jgi:hypothetical protein
MFINDTDKIGRKIRGITCTALLWCVCVFTLSVSAQTDIAAPAPRPEIKTDIDNAETFFALGKKYHDGSDVRQDFDMARSYYLQAAKLGHNGARLNLGYLSFVGQGVPQNYPQARIWYEQAAQAGDKDAALNLAMMDKNGLGLSPPQTLIKAGTKTPETALPTTPPTDIELGFISPLQQTATTSPAFVTRRNAAANYEHIRPKNIPNASSTASKPKPEIIRLSDFLPKFTITQRSYTAPAWLGTFLALLMLVLACTTAIWFIRQFTLLRRTFTRRTFAKAFYAQHRESLRGNYVRLPESQRSFVDIKDSWAVNLSTRMVRFALDRHQDTEIKCAHSDRIIACLNTSPYAARQYIYPLLGHIQNKILSDIYCTDNGTMTPKTPIQYAHENRKGNRRKRLQKLPAPTPGYIYRQDAHTPAAHIRAHRKTAAPIPSKARSEKTKSSYLKLVPAPVTSANEPAASS